MKIILWYLFLQFLFVHLPLTLSLQALPGLCYAERIIPNLNLYYWILFLRWGLVIFSHFTLPYFDALNRWVLSSPLFLGLLKMEQIATTLSPSRAKSVYRRKGVEPFQITMLLAVLATAFWALLLEFSHLHLYLGSKTAVELTGSQSLQRWTDPIVFRRNLRCWQCQPIPHLISR